MIRYAGTMRWESSQVLAGAAALWLAFAAGAALAQESQPPAAAPSPPPATEESFKPGFIDAFGRFIDDSAAKLNSQLKSANDTLGSGLKNANDALGNIGSQTSEAAKGAVGNARDAAGTIIGLPGARVVTGRERCAVAANGAPDCRAAADTACRAKGFASGRMLDTEQSRKCPTAAIISALSDRRLPSAGDCTVETFVTRAACQ
jgi:hypothetical protein